MHYSSTYNSLLGVITLACDEKENLVGLWLEGQKHFGETINLSFSKNNEIETFKMVKNWLDRYFKGQNPKISNIPLSPTGSPFRQRVWQILCEIPYGEIKTYGDIAKIIAKEQGKEKMSAQAVGGAVGHNPISIIIPCHRVVGANGNLVGYTGGIKNKIALFAHEGIDTKKFFVAKI